VSLKGQGTILEDIIMARRRRLEEAQTRLPLPVVMRQAGSRRDVRSFASALARPGVKVIAEMKKASPSAGLLRERYACGEIARAYEAAGAIALSVLTEEDYFQGALNDLVEARLATRLPVLRKDFILDAYQVYEAAAAGADAILLIVAALSGECLRALIELAGRLSLEALVEVHTEEELERALQAGAGTVGVNNRNLKTLEVDLGVSLRLRKVIPSRCRTVSESGIRSGDDVKQLMDAGYDAVLVGEWLVRSGAPGEALRTLMEQVRNA
jgi:indole-3-glycerol phosphate synthase